MLDRSRVDLLSGRDDQKKKKKKKPVDGSTVLAHAEMRALCRYILKSRNRLQAFQGYQSSRLLCGGIWMNRSSQRRSRIDATNIECGR